MSGRVSIWWGRRSIRERMLLGVVVSLVGGHLLYAGALRPVFAARAEALAAIARDEAALARLATLPEGDAAPSVAPAAEPAAAITESAPGYDLTIRRLEAQGDQTRVEIEDAGFRELILWIEELDRDQALRVIAIEIDRRPEPGVVGARLTLGR